MSNVEKLSPDIIFSCLRKNEYEFIIIKHFGALPSAKPVYFMTTQIRYPQASR